MLNKEMIENAGNDWFIKRVSSGKGILTTKEIFEAGANYAVEQLSEKVYSESDMYIIMQHIFKTTKKDGFFGGNVSFKKIYTYFINNKEKILHGNE